MANVCMLGHPAPGHVNPTLPLVAELVRRGERVTYFASPPFRERIERTGARFESCGEHALFERNLAKGGLLGGMAGLIETTEEILPALAARVRREAPDYLLVEAHAVWGNLLAQMLDVPAITLCSMFAINESLITPADLIAHMYGSAAPAQALDGLHALTRYYESARRLRRETGAICPDVVDYLGNRQALNVVFTSREFQIGGELFGDDYVFVGPSLPDRVEEVEPALQRRPNRPLVYVSMGTMYNDEAAFYGACFDAFADRPVDVVMAVGHRVNRAALPPAPANVIVREYVPQIGVLAHADVFITHGGINSAHEAMSRGVPMIVFPCAADHYVVAERVAAVGAGIVLDRARATGKTIAEAVERVLTDGRYAERSRSMGDTLRAAGGARRAADLIQRFAGAPAAAAFTREG